MSPRPSSSRPCEAKDSRGHLPALPCAHSTAQQSKTPRTASSSPLTFLFITSCRCCAGPGSPLCFNLFAPLRRRFQHGAEPRTLPSARGLQEGAGTAQGSGAGLCPLHPGVPCTPASPPQHHGETGCSAPRLAAPSKFCEKRRKGNSILPGGLRARPKAPTSTEKGIRVGECRPRTPCSGQGHGDALPPHVLGLDPPEMGPNWGHCGGQGWVPPPGTRPPSGDGASGHDTRERPTASGKHCSHRKGFGRL